MLSIKTYKQQEMLKKCKKNKKNDQKPYVIRKNEKY